MTLSHPTRNTDALHFHQSSRILKRFFRLWHTHGEHNLPVRQHEQEIRVPAPFLQHFIKARSMSDKRAKESALIVRSLIVGPSETASPRLTMANLKPRLEEVKCQLIDPKTANKVIAQLRALPISNAMVEAKEGDKNSLTASVSGPIRAVCLAYPDAELHRLHFSSMFQVPHKKSPVPSLDVAAITSLSLEKLSAIFHEMSIVDLMQPAGFGLGQPGSAKGILAGALPTPETVLNGFEQITPELMNLGYATAQTIYPDHKG
jgi:hypothetical protein